MQLILLIGLQASGKTTFAREHLPKTHTMVRRDDFRNNKRPARRELTLVREALTRGESVIADGVHAELEKRAPLIELGRDFGCEIVGYYFESSVEDCKSRNALRTGRECVPEAALYSTINVLQRPQFAEGFAELSFVRLKQLNGFEVLPWCEEDVENESQNETE